MHDRVLGSIIQDLFESLSDRQVFALFIIFIVNLKSASDNPLYDAPEYVWHGTKYNRRM